MSELKNLRKGSLRNRMLLIFLLLLTIIVLVTLYVVQRATYDHSSSQLRVHVETSASVVRDKIDNRATTLQNGVRTVAKSFNIKKLISTAEQDIPSLVSAMNNVQTRLSTDIYWVLQSDFEPMLSSIDSKDMQAIPAAQYAQEGVHWHWHQGEFYLVQSSAVKFVENSASINAWIVMGIRAARLFTDELVELTDMQVSVLHPESNLILGSTFTENKQGALTTNILSVADGLHRLLIDNEVYIYGTGKLGSWRESPVYIVLATNEDKAYLSNESLIVQLVFILVIAAILALMGAMLLSRGITQPIGELVIAAKRISSGEYVERFPSANTNEVDNLSGAISDMQQGIKEREEEINQLAFFDTLTNLPNRNQFNKHIQHQLEQFPAQKLVVLMLDVDRFKEINDTVGHDVGDELLVLISQRLVTYAANTAFFARLGGDEFGIAINLPANESADSLASSIVSLFEAPFSICDLLLDIDCSIGAAVYPTDADSSQGLLQCADIAMYSCKGTHYCHAVYVPELNKHSVLRLNLMSELKGALSEGQLVLHYQPKLSIQQNRIDTVECLIRWIHPEHGFIPPDDFIPLAEQTGSIRHVTHWALNTACHQLRQWQDKGLEFGVAVNISAMDLVDMKLPSYIAELLTRYKLPANKLTMEVTESAVMSDPENALKALNTLQTMGIILSIDDFGTGYSSMAQLKKMPVDELKIDKAFVLDLAHNTDDQIMVKTLVSLAQNLSLKTVAEGVEDLATLEFLREIGCTKAQGFYLSKALPAEQFNAWYEEFSLTLTS
jgi:diguanylate cyclase (GGDEF)-like protein